MSLAPRPAPRTGWIWLGPLLVGVLYGPTLFGSFLSDDFLMNTYLTHGEPPAMRWGEVFADFSREWADLEGSGMYRPLVSVSLGVTFAVFGMAPFWFHLLNVLLHAAAALFGAATCRRICPNAPARAAAVGGAVLALHPAIAEATCWVSARTTGLQWMFAMASLAAFASYLRTHQTWRFGACLVALVGALGSKENAVTIPVSLVAIELLIRGWRQLAWRPHVLTFGVVAAYLAFRRLVLGAFLGGDSAGVATIQSDAWLTTLGDKLAILGFPVGSGLPVELGTAVGVAGLLGIAGLLFAALRRTEGRRGTLFALALTAGWILIQLAPTYKMPADTATLLGSRMVVGACSAWAILLAILAARAATPSLAVGAATLLGASLFTLGYARVGTYRAAYADMQDLRSTMTAAAANVTPEHPLGVVTINRDYDGVTFLNCNAQFPLLERPYATTDRPLVSFGFVFQPVPDSEHLLFDVGPWRAMREHGAFLFEWHKIKGAAPLVIQDRVMDQPLEPMARLRREGRDRFLAAAPIDPREVEALEIEVEGPAAAAGAGVVRWLYFDGETPAEFPPVPAFAQAPKELRFAGGTRRGEKTVHYVDLSHALTFLALYKTRGLAGFVVTTPESTTPAAVRLRRRVDTLPLPKPLRGAAVPVAATALVAPTRPTGAESLTLYLVGPDTTHSTPVEPGPLRLDARLQALVRVILRCSRQKQYYYYFEANGTRTWRSPVDWLVFRGD